MWSFGEMDAKEMEAIWAAFGGENPFFEALRRHAEIYPQEDALVWLNAKCEIAQRLNFRELFCNARRVAMHLRFSEEVESGDRLLLVYPPSSGIDFAVAFFGCLFIGAVAVPAYPVDPSKAQSDVSRFTEIASSAGTRVALTNSSYRKVSRLVGTLVRNEEWRAIKWTCTNEVIESFNSVQTLKLLQSKSVPPQADPGLQAKNPMSLPQLPNQLQSSSRPSADAGKDKRRDVRSASTLCDAEDPVSCSAVDAPVEDGNGCTGASSKHRLSAPELTGACANDGSNDSSSDKNSPPNGEASQLPASATTSSDSRASTIPVSSSSSFSLTKAAKSSSGAVKHNGGVTGFVPPKCPSFYSFEYFEKGIRLRFEPKVVEPKSLAFLQFTSGSTASPRGVMVSFAALLHNIHLIVRACNFTDVYERAGKKASIEHPKETPSPVDGLCYDGSSSAFPHDPPQVTQKLKDKVTGTQAISKQSSCKKIDLPPAQRETETADQQQDNEDVCCAAEKFALKDYRDVFWPARHEVSLQVLGHRVRAFSWLPVYHDMGLIGCTIAPLSFGLTVYQMSPLDFIRRPHLWLEGMTRYECFTSGAPNFGFDMVTRKMPDDIYQKLDLRMVTSLLCGAEPIRQCTYKKFLEKFSPKGFRANAFLPAYGLAENTLIVSGRWSYTDIPTTLNVDLDAAADHNVFRVVDDGVVRTKQLMGCGKPCPGLEVKIVNPETLVLCPENRIGEVWVRGNSMACGYYRNDSQTESYFNCKYRLLPNVTDDGNVGTDLAAADEVAEILAGGHELTAVTTTTTEVLGEAQAEPTSSSSLCSTSNGSSASEPVQQQESSDSQEGAPEHRCSQPGRVDPEDDVSACSYLRTGDMGVLHQGQLYVTGRLKDVVIIRGRNYSPQDIEHRVEACVGVRKGCSVAFPVELNNEEVLGVAVEVRDEETPRRESGETSTESANVGSFDRGDEAGFAKWRTAAKALSWLRDSLLSKVTSAFPSAKRNNYSEMAEQIALAVVSATSLPIHKLWILKAKSLPKTTSGKVRRSYTRDTLLQQKLPGVIQYFDNPIGLHSAYNSAVPSSTSSSSTSDNTSNSSKTSSNTNRSTNSGISNTSTEEVCTKTGECTDSKSHHHRGSTPNSCSNSANRETAQRGHCKSSSSSSSTGIANNRNCSGHSTASSGISGNPCSDNNCNTPSSTSGGSAAMTDNNNNTNNGDLSTANSLTDVSPSEVNNVKLINTPPR